MISIHVRAKKRRILISNEDGTRENTPATRSAPPPHAGLARTHRTRAHSFGAHIPLLARAQDGFQRASGLRELLHKRQ